MAKTAFEQKHEDQVVHGMDALNKGGPEAIMRIDPKMVARLSELRDMMNTEPGRREIRLEVGARLALIVELGMAELGRAIQEPGIDLFDTAVMGRIGGYINSLNRLLLRWPSPVKEAIDVNELARAKKRVDEASE